jgi:Glycosyl hydrolase family 92 N-terminal domain
MQLLVNVVGWLAAIAMLAAYVLLTLGRLKASSSSYHWLNIMSGVGLMANSGWNGAYPSVCINVVWLAIGLYGVFGRTVPEGNTRCAGLPLLLGMALICCAGSAASAAATSPTDGVNTNIGTGRSSNGPEYGGAMPLVATPFGMTNWTAQTRQNRISVSSYAYKNPSISGRPLAQPAITYQQIHARQAGICHGPQPSRWASDWKPQL